MNTQNMIPPGASLTRRLRLTSLLALLPLVSASATVSFTDNFSDSSATDWRVRSATGTPNWTVAADNPAGEPTAASQWLYSNSNTAEFAFIQSPDNGFSAAAAVTAEQSVQFTAGIYYTPTVPTNGRIEFLLTDTNAAWTGSSVTDHAYSVQVNLSGSDFSLSIVKRNAGTNTNLGNSATAFSLASGTYYAVQLTIATGGSLTAKILDAGGGEVTSLVGTTDTTFTSFGSALVHFRDSGATTGFRVSDFNVETISTIFTPLDDGFTDGGRTDGADALDAAWYMTGSSGGSSLAIVDDSAGIGSGNGLRFTSSSTFQGLVANLPSAVTLADGDSILFSFEWRYTGTTNLNQDARLRFGLYNSGGTLTGSDYHTTIRSNDQGYGVFTNPGEAGSKTELRRETSGDDLLMGGNQLAIAGSTWGASINAGTTPHVGLLSIRRVGNTLVLTASIDGLTTATATDTAPLTYTFDEIAFCTGATTVSPQLIIDNAQVDYLPPTLDAINDGFTDGGRTNGADALDAAWFTLGTASLAVVDDSAGIGSGNALRQTSNNTFQGSIGNVPWFHLNDGDSVTFSFDWRFTGTSGLNQADKLRFGILNSMSNRILSDNQSGVTTNDCGYFIASNPGLASSSGTQAKRDPSGDGPLGGGTVTALGTPGASIAAGTTKHTASITLTRSGTSIIVSGSIDGLAPTTGTDTDPVSYSFDEVGILLVGSTPAPNFLMDNVRWTYVAANPAPATEGPPPGTWTLTLDENFNGTALTTSRWSKGMRWADVLWHDKTDPTTKELQGYVPENVTVANGLCTILTEKRSVQNTDWVGYKGEWRSYASGAIQTWNKWTQAYGYFEARVRMSGATGTWPAFWLLPDRGAGVTNLDNRVAVGNPAGLGLGNEIDIFEYMGSWKNQTTGLSRSHSGYFWNYSGGVSGDFIRMNGMLDAVALPEPDTQFHTYGVYWAPGQLVFYIDGQVVLRRDNQTTVGWVPHYIILNTALSTHDWIGTPITTANIDAALPSTMDIDYVRVYSGTPATAP